MLQVLGCHSQLPTNAVVHMFSGVCDRCADMLALAGLYGSSTSAFMLPDSIAAADAGLQLLDDIGQLTEVIAACALCVTCHFVDATFGACHLCPAERMPRQTRGFVALRLHSPGTSSW